MKLPAVIVLAVLLAGCNRPSQAEHRINAALIAADDGRPDDIAYDFDRKATP